MLSKTALTMTSASRRAKRGKCFSTSSIRSRLVMDGTRAGSSEGEPRVEVEEPSRPGRLAEERGAEQLERPQPAPRAHAVDARLAALPRLLPGGLGRHRETAQLVDQAGLERLRAGEDAPVRHLADASRLHLAALRDRLDELRQHVVLHRLQERALVGRERAQRMAGVLEAAALHDLLR